MMADDGSRLNRVVDRRHRVTLLAGGILLLAWPLTSAERPHVSLVDPATTDCVVCHESLSKAIHAEVAATQCIDCHGFSRIAEATKVFVDRASLPDEPPVPVRRSPAAANRELGTERPTSGNPTDRTTDRMISAEPTASQEGIDSRDAVPSSSRGSKQSALNLSDSAGGSPIPARSRERYAAALAAFRNGDFEAAVTSWREMLTDAVDFYTIQVEVDRQLDSVNRLFAEHRNQPLYVVIRQDLYWVCAGLFFSQADAERAIHELPDELRYGGAFPTPVKALGVPIRPR